MAMFLLSLGLVHQREERFEAAYVAYTRARDHVARLPPGPEREIGLKRIAPHVKGMTRRSGREPADLCVAQTTPAEQTPEQRLALWGDALEETREAVLAVRATRALVKAAGAGPGPRPESGGAKASKAQRRRQRRKQRKHQPRP
jgi:hypothetical protein